MNFCLSDLVPPLRWSDAATIPLLRDQPDLPDAWWRSLPMAHVLAVLPPERLAEILTALALSHWPAATVGDVLPALHVLDPDEADEPCTAIALDRAGSWPGLLALTGHDLRDQPFIQPVPLLHALFTAVFARLAAPVPATPLPVASVPVASVPAPAARSESAPGESDAIPNESEATPAPVPGTGPGVVTESPAEPPAPPAESATDPEALPEPEARPEPEALAEPEALPVPEARRAAETKAETKAEAEPAAVPGSLFQPGPARDGLPTADPARNDTPAAGMEARAAASGEARPTESSAESVPESEVGADAPVESVTEAGEDSVPADAPEAAGAPEPEKPEKAVRSQGAERPAESLHALVDGVFANVEDKRWAVAQNRLFSDTPATAEALAKLFAVRPEVIFGIEVDLRRELGEWIASDEAAPYREHLEEMKRLLGRAAPKERLINAADWHTQELYSLDIPAWQFVLATLPGYHLVDEWLVEGDIAELRHRTRDMLSEAPPPLTINKALDMVSSLGIHPEVSKEWLENVPQLRILGAGERPPQRPNGVPALIAEMPAGVPRKNGEPAKAPFRPLKDVSLTRRCFRQPDGRWWLRIDVTSDHLQGAECSLPSGFAAYLGMSPGEGRTVSSAVGELVLSWHDRPVLESLRTLLEDVGAKEGSHLFLTLSDEGVLRARHLPASEGEGEATAQALRLVGYTASGGTPEQAGRVIATRVGMTGPVGIPDLLTRLRERGDRDLLSLLA
ncbi:hypothetical protein OG884_10690 [Streptosporangium sp. NBC_01755]|uniref:hypothetical protein n=1 Tax=unclassified Streptosporangium TaxID=2632669 RepID=UPI002DDB9A02|nr:MULTISPECIES: hypothetical protein [unclassified Streptosporangium]WSA26226.1 hypothetical protein OIE13_35995 [Streptosporangium sp. NBC_01810]WSD02346.1 hypothetical protein OG884_10690 [Streptosporangium sp. NBC_01755]